MGHKRTGGSGATHGHAMGQKEGGRDGVVESDNDFGYGILMKPGCHPGLWYDADDRFRANFHYVSDSYRLMAPPRLLGMFVHLAARMTPNQGEYVLFVNGFPVSDATLRRRADFQQSADGS